MKSIDNYSMIITSGNSIYEMLKCTTDTCVCTDTHIS